MLKKLTTISSIAICLFFLSSCNPIPTFKQVERSNTIEKQETPEITTTGDSITISFVPVLNADSYAFVITNIETNESLKINKTVSELDNNGNYKNGLFSYTVSPLRALSNYKVEVFAYKGNAESSVQIESTTTNKYSDASQINVNPLVEIIERTDNQATLEITNVNGASYISVKGENIENKNYKLSNDKTTEINIENLNIANEYPIELSFALTDNVENSSKSKTTIIIPSYLILKETTIDNFSSPIIDEDDPFFGMIIKKIHFKGILTNIPSEYNSLETKIYMSLNNGLDYEQVRNLENKSTISDNSFDLSGTLDTIKDYSAQHLYFAQVEFKDDQNNIIARSSKSDIISDQIQVKTEITTSSNKIIISWNELNDIDYYKISRTNKDNSLIENILQNESIKTENSKTSFTYNAFGIEPNTTYYFSIKGIKTNGKEITIGKDLIEVKTDINYEGTYEWVNTDQTTLPKNFVLDVKTNPNYPENSIYPYYFFVSSLDSNFQVGTDDNYRIMPLIDNEDISGSVNNEGFIEYNSQTLFGKAYKWNEGKWNALGMHPTAWKIEKSPSLEEAKNGNYTFITKSNTAFGIYDTISKFYFRERKGIRELVFSNKGYGDNGALVNIGINTNPKPEEGDDQFTFALKLKEEN